MDTSRKSIGLGIPALIANVAVCLTGNLDQWWGVTIIGVGALGAAVDELVAGRLIYAIAWLVSMSVVILGYVLWEPWGALVGLVLGTMYMQPVVDTFEHRERGR